MVTMATIDTIEKLIKTHGSIIRTSDVLEAGLSRTTLSKMERDGKLVRVARGQYILPDELPDELFLWQKRKPLLVYSHETALFLHDMAERTPAKHSITLPSNARLSATFPGDLKVYFITPGLLELGIDTLRTKMGHEVRCYNIERTVCDILRSRNKVDDQTVIAAIKNYASLNDKDLVKLGRYSEVFNITKILRQYLEVLL